MNQEKWEDIKGRILDTFEEAKKGRDEDDIGVTEWIEFENHAGKRMRLEWRDQKVKLGEKTLSSKRPGAQVKIEAEYSETERAQHMTLYIWDDDKGDWIEGDASALL